jgi:hypothetical protein
VYGRTDDFGYKAVENRVSVPNLQATLFHLLGSRPFKAHVSPRRSRRDTNRVQHYRATVVGDLLKKPPKVA